jgi:HK97 family phage portal protein
VIYAGRDGANRELRLFEGSGLIPRPGSPDIVMDGAYHAAAIEVDAVACALGLLSESIGSFSMRTYSGGDGADRQPVKNAWQNRLFQEPGNGYSPFDLWADTVCSLELEKAAFLWKTVGRSNRVVELYPVDARYFRVTRKSPSEPREIKARIDGRLEDVSDQVVYIRSWSPSPSSEGASNLELHHRSFRQAIALEEYTGSYFDNNGAPGIVLTVPGSPDRAERKAMLESWEKRHARARNAGKPGLLWGGMTAERLGDNLKDAQTAELTAAIVRKVARIFRIYPADLLHQELAEGKGKGAATAALLSDIFFRFSLMPRLARITSTIALDRDIYPNPAHFPAFDTAALVHADFATAADKAHNLVQSGVLTKNEGRGIIGFAPVPGGDTFQETPVGGAPNAGGKPDDSSDQT